MRVLLTRKWLPALPDVVKRLERGGRVADIGCGSGTSTLTLAQAYPRSEITGYDIDATALARARSAAERLGVANARFEQRSAEELPQEPGFDLVTAFDVVHDLAKPRAVLRRIRKALASDGTFLLVEPAAGDGLAQNLNPSGALLYSISTLYCMTVSLSQGGEGLGAAYGPKQAESLCRAAGFGRFRRLDIENPFNAFYEVRP
jgi:ubiquinone/menaquinone biosynthesis C-methylase UbiE